MSNKEFKKINENWEKFVENEPEQLNEIAIMAMLAAGLTKFFIALFWGVQNKEKINGISQNIQAQEKVPPQVKKLFDQIDITLKVAEEAAPHLAKAVEATGSNWNPLAWKSNVILALIKKWTEPDVPELTQEPEVAPSPGAPTLEEDRKKNEKK